MREYYYLEGAEKMGPFTLEELKAQKINRSTKIWRNPWSDWKPAWQIPELSEYLKGMPPEVGIPILGRPRELGWWSPF